MEKILVLDVETSGAVNVDNSFCYDIGFMVCDLNGEIFEKHSYTVADYFLDKELMENAFYKDKIPQYWEDIKTGKRQLRRLTTIKFILRDVIRQYNITKIFAYNIKFDYDALLSSERLATCSKYRYFLPYGMEICDILKFGRELAKTKEYKEFCKENNYLTKNNRAQTKAEVVARFLFKDDFVESHTGLEDCEIEHKILCELYERFPMVDYHLW